MDAYLMRPSRLDATRNARDGATKRVRSGKHLPIRDGFFAISLNYRHALAVDGVASDEIHNASSIQSGASVANGEVSLFDIGMP